jgi:hypothetical protein
MVGENLFEPSQLFRLSTYPSFQLPSFHPSVLPFFHPSYPFMPDIIYIIVTVLFFVLSILFVFGCEKV